MRNSLKELVALGFGCLLLISARGFGQSETLADSTSASPGGAPVVSPASRQAASSSGEARFGVAGKLSLLGGGFELAGRVSQRTNVRAGFNMFDYSLSFDNDGISYARQLNFRTFEAHYDFFPRGGGFHVSPGLLVFLGDPITANASVASGNTFTLNDQQYVNRP